MLYQAAIPPHLRRGEPRRKCYGRPGCGRPGRWRRHCQFGPQLRRSPNCQRLRGSARISVVASYLYSSDSACSREPLYPAPTSEPRSQGGPSRPRPGRPSATHSVGLFRCSREPVVSLPRRSRARRPFPFQTASGATLHFVPRPMALADSQPPHKAPATTFASVRLPAP